MEPQLARVGARHLKLPLASKNPLVMRRNAAALTEIIRRHKIDIVHARSRAPAWSAWSAARATGRRFVTTFHNAYDADLPLKHWYNSVMAKGERVIAISHFVGEHVAQVYGVGSDRLRVIPRGVDIAQFNPQRVSGDRVIGLATSWRVPEDATVVMLPGRLTRWKGGLDFIEAIARLGRRDVCCLLVGAEQRPGFRRELEARIEQRGLGGMFRIVEDCRDMPAAFAAADTVLVPAIEAPILGRVVAEAQAMGRPVVTSDIGILPEHVVTPPEMPEDVRTGWLAEPGDAADFARALGIAFSLDATA